MRMQFLTVCRHAPTSINSLGTWNKKQHMKHIRDREIQWLRHKTRLLVHYWKIEEFLSGPEDWWLKILNFCERVLVICEWFSSCPIIMRNHHTLWLLLWVPSVLNTAIAKKLITQSDFPNSFINFFLNRRLHTDCKHESSSCGPGR